MNLPVTHTRLLQVLAVAWLFTGQSVWWPSPEGVPFAWTVALGILSTGLCGLLVWGRHQRVAAAALAGLIALEWLAVPTWFAHNRLFVGALLITVALSNGGFAWLPRVQVALVYAVAAGDKLLSAPWRDGRFFTSFLEQLARFGLMWSPAGTVGAPNGLARLLAESCGPSASAVLGWSVIALEFMLALAFLARWRWAVWPNLLFHACVFSLTGSPMGQFFFAGSAASLLLLEESEVPPAGGLMFLALLLAGPWTHRALPWVALFWLNRRGRSGR